MTQAEIDHYLEILDEPKRSTLRELRESILSVIPEADQGLSYNIPAFRLNGKVVAGFAAFKSHLSYLPFSGSVFPELRDDLSRLPDVHRRPAIPDRSALAPFLGREADCGPLEAGVPGGLRRGSFPIFLGTGGFGIVVGERCS